MRGSQMIFLSFHNSAAKLLSLTHAVIHNCREAMCSRDGFTWPMCTTVTAMKNSLAEPSEACKSDSPPVKQEIFTTAV